MKNARQLVALGVFCLTYSLMSCSDGHHVSDATGESSLPSSSSEEDEYFFIDSTLHVDVQRYRALNFNKDTTVWEPSDCEIKDSTFSCDHFDRYDYSYGVRDDIWDSIFDDENPSKKRSGYRDTIYDTTYTDINFGKNALVHYTPVAEIPEFDREAVAKALSKLSGERCSQIFELRSNYNLKVIGLPGFSWKNEDDVMFGYDAYVDMDDSGQEKCSVQGARIQYTMNPHYSVVYRRSLPEELDDNTLQFFNGTLTTFQDTTISWKLVYTDQYRRADTFDITTKFEMNDSDSLRIRLSGFYDGDCYDAIEPSNCK